MCLAPVAGGLADGDAFPPSGRRQRARPETDVLAQAETLVLVARLVGLRETFGCRAGEKIQKVWVKRPIRRSSA